LVSTSPRRFFVGTKIKIALHAPILHSSATMQQAIDTLCDTKNEADFSWVVGDEKVELVEQGSGLESLRALLADDSINFACLRVVGVDEQENVQSRRAKYIRINWVGKKVAGMKKMKALSSKALAESIMTGVAVDLNADDHEDLNMNNIGLELLKCGGAHKPTKYWFSEGEEIPLADLKQTA
jgi:hypothetical protein